LKLGKDQRYNILESSRIIAFDLIGIDDMIQLKV